MKRYSLLSFVIVTTRDKNNIQKQIYSFMTTGRISTKIKGIIFSNYSTSRFVLGAILCYTRLFRTYDFARNRAKNIWIFTVCTPKFVIKNINFFSDFLQEKKHYKNWFDSFFVCLEPFVLYPCLFRTYDFARNRAKNIWVLRYVHRRICRFWKHLLIQNLWLRILIFSDFL